MTYELPEPEPPQNVRVTWPDGTVVPVELVHTEWKRDAQGNWTAVWVSVGPVNPGKMIEQFSIDGVSISADVLPAHTSIHLRWEEWNDAT